MSLSLIIVSAFECQQKVHFFVLSSLSIVLSTKTTFATNINPLSLVNSLF